MGIQALRAGEFVDRTPKVLSGKNEEVLVEKNFGSWVTIKPVLVDRNKGICHVMFNPDFQDLSVFNDDEKLRRLNQELSELGYSSKIQCLVISLEGCHSSNKLKEKKHPGKILSDNQAQISGSEYLAERFIQLRNTMETSGKKLELAHVEKDIFRILESIKAHFIHENEGDAIIDALNNATQSLQLPAQNDGHLKLFTEHITDHPEDYSTDHLEDHLPNPATVDISENYLG